MRELDRKIDAWCRSVHPEGRRHEAKIEELKDHIHCVVEGLIKEGMSSKEAFLQATQQTGDVQELKNEHAKNNTLIDRLEKWSNQMTPKKLALTQIVLALVAAGVMLAADAIVAGAEYEQTITYTILAIWFVPFMYLAGKETKLKQT